MRSKLVYSCSIKKIYALRFDKLLGSIFCLLLVADAFSLQKVVKMLEEVVVGWWEFRWIWWMRQNLIKFLFNFWGVGCVICGRALLGRITVSFLLTNASCMCWSFRCISFFYWAYFSDVIVSPGYRKLWQQATKQWPRPFYGASLALGSALELLLGPITEWFGIGGCIKSTFCPMSQSDQEMVHCCCIE